MTVLSFVFTFSKVFYEKFSDGTGSILSGFVRQEFNPQIF